MIYKFRVGTKDIGGFELIRPMGYNHACLLLNEDIFEYGPQGYERHKNVGRDPSFDWFELGNILNGTTRITPDQLERAILNDGSWIPERYVALTHNCHNFVGFCLDRIGCPKGMYMKNDFCFKPHYNNPVTIRSALDNNKVLDICGRQIKNWTQIILFRDNSGFNQAFDMIAYDDGAYAFVNSNKFAIDVENGQAFSGAKIQLYELNNTKAQKFYLIKREAPYFSIHSALNPKYVIDVSNGDSNDGTKIQLWEYNGTKAQFFKI